MDMNMKYVGFVGFIGIVSIYTVAIAGGVAPDGQLDANSAQALKKTQQLLLDQQSRQAAIHENSQTQAADQQVQKITGGNAALNDSMYGLSADVVEDLAQMSGGDPVKMQEILAQAQANPQAFKAKLSAKNQRSFEALAQSIEAQQKNRTPSSR